MIQEVAAKCHPERPALCKGLCVKCYYAQWHALHPSSHRQTKLKRYGITAEEYDRLLNKQHGCCAICRRAPNGRRLSVDHDHLTGKVRGLLCSRCNRAIGMFLDNQGLLDRAIRYLNG